MRLHILMALVLWPVMVDSGCPKTDNGCTCMQLTNQINGIGGWQITCNDPKTNQNMYGIKYSVNTEVEVECGSEAPYKKGMFQNMSISEINFFHFTDCPLPNITVKDILQDQATITAIQFAGYNSYPAPVSLVNLLKGLNTLRNLAINRYNLSQLPLRIFDDVSSLQTLSLEHNSIQKLEAGIFRDLVNLEALYLLNNSLSELPETIFENLTSLQQLYLKDNELSELQPNLFRGLVSLQFLTLINNNIKHLPAALLLTTTSLTNFYVGQNNLSSVEPGLFHKNLTNLACIDFGYNPDLTEVPENLISTLESLKIISFFNCTIMEWPENFFSASQSLLEINMSGNNITALPISLFQRNVNLTSLDLSYNLMETLQTGVFARLFSLETLMLNNNRLKTLGKNAFESLGKLKSLDLSFNNLTSINQSDMYGLFNLETLRLNDNEIQILGPGMPFGESTALIEIYLFNNSLRRIPRISWSQYLSLQTIDFQNNKIDIIDLPRLFSSNNEPVFRLLNNAIKTISVLTLIENDQAQVGGSPQTSKTVTQFYLENNPLLCDCRLYQFKSYAQGGKSQFALFSDFGSLYCFSNHSQTRLLTDQPDSSFTCSITEECPAPCDCYMRALDNASVVNCTGLALRSLPDRLPKNTSMALFDHNNLSTLFETRNPYWESVQELRVTDNQIVTGEWVLPSSLRRLFLANNKLEILPNCLATFVNSSPQTRLTLDGNPWSCNCSGYPLKVLITQRYQQITTQPPVLCTTPSNFEGEELMSIKDSDMCPSSNTERTTIIVAITLCLALALFAFIICLIYYKNKKIIIAYIYVHYYKMYSIFFKDDFDEDKVFDAFISYSNEDREIAMKLVEKLENSGEPSYKLCIHERDWLPGNLVIYNIVNSVQNSRRTILILSEDFINSVWFQLEFRIAYHHMLEDKIDRLIIIVRDDLPKTDTLDEDLRVLLSAKTYLVFGEQWFWEKLSFALPHKKHGVRPTSIEVNPSSDLISKIEDKIMSYMAETMGCDPSPKNKNEGEFQLQTLKVAEDSTKSHVYGISHA